MRFPSEASKEIALPQRKGKSAPKFKGVSCGEKNRLGCFQRE